VAYIVVARFSGRAPLTSTFLLPTCVFLTCFGCTGRLDVVATRALSSTPSVDPTLLSLSGASLTWDDEGWPHFVGP
jgi:hypothetical protein